MTQVNIVISRKFQFVLFCMMAFLLAGCNEEVSPYSYNCKNFNEKYLNELSENQDIGSARELARLYVECNPEGVKKYDDLALKWSEKVLEYNEANEDDVELYRALRDLDIDTGEPET